MAKVAEKVPKRLLGNETFKKELNNSVWSELIEPEEFEASWQQIIDKYELEGVDWFKTMFESRQYWVPAYFRDFAMSSLIKTTSVSESQNIFFKRYSKSRSNLVVFLMNYNNALESQRNHSSKYVYMDSNTTPKMKTKLSIEKHAATIYTDYGFKAIQEQISDACFTCSMVYMPNNTDNEVYKVLDHFSNTWEVTYTASTDVYSCRCKMFERIGLMCCHIFFILKNNNVKLIPENLYACRWLKTALIKPVHGVVCDDVETHVYVDNKRKAFNEMYASFFELAQGVYEDIDKIHTVMGIIEETKQQMKEDGIVMSAMQKKQRIEEFYGCEVPKVIEVHPPAVVSTKGSGSRIKARLEKAQRVMSKPLRKCAKCHEYGHHDSRNCDKVQEKSRQRSQIESQI